MTIHKISWVHKTATTIAMHVRVDTNAFRRGTSSCRLMRCARVSSSVMGSVSEHRHRDTDTAFSTEKQAGKSKRDPCHGVSHAHVVVGC
jgi:hypothetical protein